MTIAKPGSWLGEAVPLLALAAAAWLLLASCSTGTPSPDAKRQAKPSGSASELEIELEALEEVALPRAAPLRILNSFPPLGDNGASPPMMESPVYGPSRGVLACDQKRWRVLRIRPDFSGWEAFTALLDDYPVTLDVRGEVLYVDVSGRIESFRGTGSRGFSFHTFYTLFDFSAAPDGSLWLNPRWTRARPDEPLLVHLDSQGRRIGALGERNRQEGWRGLLDHAFVASDGRRVWAVHERTPLVRSFDAQAGRQMWERRIEHPLFERVRRAASWPVLGPQGRSVRAPRYAAGVALAPDALYVLLHLPFVEILQLDLEGREQARYRWRESGFQALDFGGMDVRRSRGGEPIFVVSALRSSGPDSPAKPALLELGTQPGGKEPLS